MNIRISTTNLVVLTLLASFLQGGVIPGRWEKVDGLQPGSKIILTLKAGDRLKCTFKDSDSTSLRISDAGQELVIPKDSIAKVVRENRRSNKPAVIGAAIGALAGVASAAGSPAPDMSIFGEPVRRDRTSITVSCILFGAVLGYLTGYYGTKKPPDQLLYEASEIASPLQEK
jgi:hypothetical protein